MEEEASGSGFFSDEEEVANGGIVIFSDVEKEANNGDNVFWM